MAAAPSLLSGAPTSSSPAQSRRCPAIRLRYGASHGMRQIAEQLVDERRLAPRQIRRAFPGQRDVHVQRVERGDARAVAPRKQAEDDALDADALLEHACSSGVAPGGGVSAAPERLFALAVFRQAVLDAARQLRRRLAAAASCVPTRARRRRRRRRSIAAAACARTEVQTAKIVNERRGGDYDLGAAAGKCFSYQRMLRSMKSTTCFDSRMPCPSRG